MDLALVHLRVAEGLLEGLDSATEEVIAEPLGPRTRERGVEVDTLQERVDLDRRLGGGDRVRLARSQAVRRRRRARWFEDKPDW